MHREISPRRMRRWLERRCAEHRKGRRVGLAPYPLNGGLDGWIVGERIRMRIPVGPISFTVLRPVVIGVARMMSNYTFAHIKAAKVELADESLHDKVQAYRGKQREAVEKRKSEIQAQMLEEFEHRLRARPMISVPR